MPLEERVLDSSGDFENFSPNKSAVVEQYVWGMVRRTAEDEQREQKPLQVSHHLHCYERAQRSEWCDGTPPLSPIQGVGFDKIDKCLSRSRRLAAFNSLKTCYALRKRFFKFNFSEMEMVRHPAYK